MLAGVVLAWPEPSVMLPVALLNFAVLTGLALTLEVPAAHVLAGSCLTLAYLLGWLVISGRLGWQGVTEAEAMGALLSGRSGMALAPIVLLFGGATVAGLRLGRRLDAQALGMVAGLAGAFSVGLMGWHGFGRTGQAAAVEWVYALYAVAALVGAPGFGRCPLVGGTTGKIEERVLGWTGSALLLAAALQGFVFGTRAPALALPWVVALLAHASVTAVLAVVLGAWRRDEECLRAILTRSALATSIVAAVWLAVVLAVADPGTLARHLGWLALVWLVLACEEVQPALFAAMQAALTGSVVFAVAAGLARRSWYVASRFPWLDPRTLQAQGMALGLLSLAWIALRLGVRVWSRPEGPTARAKILVDPPWPAMDRYPRWVLLVMLVALAVYGVLPGAAAELTPRGMAARYGSGAFELTGIPHGPAIGAGSWGLMGLVVAVLLAGGWERFRRSDLLGVLLAASMAGPLLAGRWEADGAVASALQVVGGDRAARPVGLDLGTRTTRRLGAEAWLGDRAKAGGGTGEGGGGDRAGGGGGAAGGDGSVCRSCGAGREAGGTRAVEPRGRGGTVLRGRGRVGLRAGAPDAGREGPKSASIRGRRGGPGREPMGCWP